MIGAAERRPLRRAGDAVSTFFYRRRRFYLWLLLAPPLLWLGAAFAGALLALIWQSTYTFDDFSMQVTRDLTWANYRALFSSTNLDIVLRTVGMALAVTIACAVLGFPLAYYMARYTRGTRRGLFYIGVMLPMWASYIVKAYAWTMILSKGGIIYWVADRTGLRVVLDWLLTLPWVGGTSLSTSNLGRLLVFTYAWLPFMILPTHAAIERVPAKLLEASADLGARPLQTFRTVLLPLAFPGVVAGSIFVFSLTMGDFVAPQLVGGGSQVLGGAIKDRFGVAADFPFGAALASLTLVTLVVFLTITRRTGALENL